MGLVALVTDLVQYCTVLHIADNSGLYVSKIRDFYGLAPTTLHNGFDARCLHDFYMMKVQLIDEMALALLQSIERLVTSAFYSRVQ